MSRSRPVVTQGKAEALGCAAPKKQHLGIPVVGTKRPAVMEHDGLTLALVLVEDLDAVLGCNHAHSLVFRVD